MSSNTPWYLVRIIHGAKRPQIYRLRNWDVKTHWQFRTGIAAVGHSLTETLVDATWFADRVANPPPARKRLTVGSDR